jgi:phosphate starvation-inducible protein PhoH
MNYLKDEEYFETKKTRRNKKQKNTSLDLKQITPITDNQAKTFSYYNKNNLVLHGLAGTGKTFIAIYLALQEILNQKSEKNTLILVRSVVPTRDMGFLPGNQKEKQKAYEAPYYGIFTELFGRGDAYDYLKTKGIVEFTSTSFIRGITLKNSIVIVDECQNMSFHELDSIITRIGENCKILFCGDFRQSDLQKDSDKKGLKLFLSILKKLKEFKTIDFKEEDIVRSAMIKAYIIEKSNVQAQ